MLCCARLEIVGIKTNTELPHSVTILRQIGLICWAMLQLEHHIHGTTHVLVYLHQHSETKLRV